MFSALESEWFEILRMVPLTISWSRLGKNSYPFVVFYADIFSNTDQIQLMGANYANTSYFMGSYPIPSGVIDSNHNLIEITEEIYFEFWQDYNDVVISTLENKTIATKASLFASSINAPLIFADSTNVDTIYSTYISRKNVYLFDRENLDGTDSMNSIDNLAGSIIYISKDGSEGLSYLDLPYSTLNSKVTILN